RPAAFPTEYSPARNVFYHATNNIHHPTLLPHCNIRSCRCASSLAISADIPASLSCCPTVPHGNTGRFFHVDLQEPHISHQSYRQDLPLRRNRQPVCLS